MLDRTQRGCRYFIAAWALCAVAANAGAQNKATPNNNAAIPQANPYNAVNASTKRGGECGTRLTPEIAVQRLINEANGMYDPPLVRSTMFVPMTFHIVRMSDGTGGIPHSQLCQGLADLNTAYAPIGVHFYLQGPLFYIDDDSYYFDVDTDAEIDAMIQIDSVPNTINVYFTPNLANENGGLCGRASFTSSFPQGVAMSNDCTGLATNHSTFAHEIGHYFDLLHTHSTFFGVECVDGSNCATAGDRLCDTPADPNLDGVVDAACVYTGGASDPCNNDPYVPDTTNLMSYSTKECRDFFSNGQFALALATLTNLRPELIHNSIPLPWDCNQNGVSDFCEADCGSNTMPGGCAQSGTDCNSNTIDDACEIADALAFDCNENFIPDDCELGANDCNNNGIPDECDVMSGFSEDCQPNGVPDECELGPNDCNNNGVPDDCDVASGFSDDCNNNGVPDECDVMSGTSEDCQPDGIPDECQLGGCLNQSDYGTAAQYSDVDFPQFSAENFVLPVGTTVSRVQFWGEYLGVSPVIHDQFMIVFREDNAGLPGNALYIYGPLEADLKLGVGGDVYEYTVVLPGLTNLGIGTYWVEIYNDTTGTPGAWGWMLAPFDPVDGLEGSAFSSTLPENWNFVANNDLALRVYCNSKPDNDCNSDGIPDDCQLGMNDCNNNGIPDDCDTKPDGDPSIAVEQDLCEDAMIVCPGFDYVGTNMNSTLSDGTFFCGLLYSTKDVWYRYRPAYDGLAFVRVEGPPWLWIYSIYDGCPGAGGMEVKCNTTDHFNVVWNAEAGHEYYIRIGAHGINTMGSFEMNLAGPPCALNEIDLNGNGIPDECECLPDVNNDNVVDMTDFALALANYGTCLMFPCTGDVNGDGVVNDTDLYIILNNQGPCPFPVMAQHLGIGTDDPAGDLQPRPRPRK